MPLLITISKCRVQFQQQAEVASTQAGVLESLCFREGDVVQEGEIIAQIDSKVASYQLMVSQSKVHRYGIAMAGLEKHMADVNLQAGLKACRRVSGAVSNTEMTLRHLKDEYARLVVEKAGADLRTAQAEMEVAKAILCTYTIKAPFSGMITHCWVEPGESVQLGTPLVSLVSKGRYRALGFVPVYESKRLKRGMVAKHGAILGVVTFISPEVDQLTGTVLVWSVFETDEIMYAGECIDVNVVVGD